MRRPGSRRPETGCAAWIRSWPRVSATLQVASEPVHDHARSPRGILQDRVVAPLLDDAQFDERRRLDELSPGPLAAPASLVRLAARDQQRRDLDALRASTGVVVDSRQQQI